MNPFEAANRAKKVDALVQEIDWRMEAAGIDVFDPGVADGLAKWPLEAWEALGEEIPLKNKPSAITVAEVIQFYRNRARRGAA